MADTSSWTWNSGPALYPEAESWWVRGSLPNQSTCVLSIWRRHSTASLGDSCGGGGFSRIMGCQAQLCKLCAPCMTGVRVWFALVGLVSGEGWTPPGLSFVIDFVQNFYGQNFETQPGCWGSSVWCLQDRLSALCRWCGPVGFISPWPPALVGPVRSRVWSGWEKSPFSG